MPADTFRDPFTAENTAFLFVDHQIGMLDIVADQPRDQLRTSVVAIANAAKALKLPIVLSSASTDMIGPTIPELAQALSDVDNIERTLINAWDDQRIREAVEATGRRKLVFGAIGTNVCLALATISAAADGYEAYAAIDISGTANELLRAAAIERMTQAGVGIIDAPSVIFQILNDNASPLAADVYTAMGPLLAPPPDQT
jgi:nicotinamidase-related amidase